MEAAGGAQLLGQYLVALKTLAAEIAPAGIGGGGGPVSAPRTPPRRPEAGVFGPVHHRHGLASTGTLVCQGCANHASPNNQDIWGVEPGLHRCSSRYRCRVVGQ